MKNNKKRGFTLVELLVVIAILAILATVAVVGYTSFITRARVSNDEEVANQLNDYWTALRADSMGEYYGKDITQDNVWYVTQAILQGSGIETYAPQSLQDGYHLYFKFNPNGINGEFVVKKESELHSHLGSPAMRLLAALGIHAAPANSEYDMPGIFYDASNIMYFLVDTHGSDIAKAVRGFYSLDGDFENDVNSFVSFINGLTDYPEFADKLANSTLVTKNETIPAPSGTTNFLFVYGGDECGATYVPNITIEVNRDITIILPGTIEALGPNNINIVKTDSSYKVTIDISLVDRDSVAPGFATGETDGTIVDNGNGSSDILDSEGNVEGEEITEEEQEELNNQYPVGSFTLNCGSVIIDSLTKLKATGSDIFVAYDYNSGSFTLTPTNFKGVDGKPYSTEELVWSVSGDTNAEDGVAENAYVTVVDGAVTIKGAIDEDVTITATAKAGGFAVSMTLKAVKVTGVEDVTLGGETLLLDGTDSLIFSNTNNGGTNSAFTLNYGEISYNYPNTGVDVDLSIEIVNANPELALTNNNLTLALRSDLYDLLVAKTVTVKINELPEKAVSIRMFNADNLTFQLNTANNKIKVVGDGNPILLGDLFTHNTLLELPANAQVWFSSSFGDTSSLPGDIDMSKEYESDYGVTTNVLANNDWKNTPIQFLDGNATSAEAMVDSVSVAIVVPTEDGGYRRISAVREISVVKGYNIKTGQYATLKQQSDAGNSIVLLGNVTMDEADSYFDIKANATFYGNTFTLDIRNGRKVEAGIINLSGRIQDTKVLGAAYTGFAVSVGSNWGSSAICTKGENSEIENCYVTGCRSPLRVEKDVKIKDSIFYGGRYSNIDITAGNVYIYGEVMTINQNDDGYVGMGVAFWWSANADTSKIIIEKDASGNEIAKLTQYNFLSQNDGGAMPNIGIVELAGEAGVDLSSFSRIPGLNSIGINLGTIFTEDIMGNSIYDDGIFVKNGVKYVNTGVVYISEPADSTDAIFQHLGKYASSSYTYDPAEEYKGTLNYLTRTLFQKVLEAKTGIKTLPIFINAFESQYLPEGATEKVKREDNYTFLDTALANANNYGTSYDFGADGKIITYGK